MTRDEAAVISAYTGYLIGEFSAVHEYAERVLGRPIWTHQFPSIADELREKSRADFMALEVVESATN